MESKPVISALTPSQGPRVGGTRVVVAGENFADGCKIAVDGVEVPASFLSSTQLAFVTPPRATGGKVDVQVVLPGLTSEPSDESRFEYEASPAPSIVSISPRQGPLAGGIEVTLAGVHFVVGCRVSIGEVSVDSIFDAPIQLRVTIPPRTAPGSVDVKVVLPDGQSATLEGGFEYARSKPPKIERIDPKSGPAAGGTRVIVEGTDFADRVVIELDGVPLSSTREGPNKIAIVTPPRKEGGVAWLRIVNPDGQFDVFSEGFSYDAARPPPSILSLDPPRAIVGEGETRVAIVGRDFDESARVQIGGVDATIGACAREKIVVVAPERGPVGAVDVRVTNADGQSALLARGFTYQLPAPPVGVAGFRPPKGPVSGGTTVLVTGANFEEGCFVEIGGGRARATFDGKATLTFVTPPARLAGVAELRVVRPDGAIGVAPEGFRYEPVPPPKIVTMEPRQGSAAGGWKLQISGNGFAEGVVVLVRGTEAKTRRIDAETLEVVVPKTDEPGLADVEVRNPDRQSVVSQNAIDYFRAR